MVDGEGQECDVVCVDGLDDGGVGGVGDGAVGASHFSFDQMLRR